MKIKLSDLDAIRAALDDVQNKSRVRTISAENIAELCKRVETRLDIPKSALKGVAFTADYNAQAFPNAYKGRPESTHVSALHNGREWIITGIYRADCRRPTVAIDVQLTDGAQAAIIRRAQTFPA